MGSSNKFSGLCLLLALGTLAYSSRAFATLSANLLPLGDAFVTPGPTNNRTNSNYGAAGALGVAASGLSAGQFDSVLKFNATTAKSTFDTAYGAGNWTVQSATLTLTTTSPNNAIFNGYSPTSPSNTAGLFSVNLMPNTSWAEGTGTPATPTTDGITFTTLPNYTSVSDPSLGTFSFTGGTSGALPPYALASSSALTFDVLSGGVVGLHLSAADSSIAYLFNSNNNGTVGNRPVFTVTAQQTPEPTGLAMLVLAGGALLQRRTR